MSGVALQLILGPSQHVELSTSTCHANTEQLTGLAYLAHLFHAADHFDPGNGTGLQGTAPVLTQQVNLIRQ